MAARRSTKKVDTELNIDAPAEVAPAEVTAPPARKYFSHANCDHARKGEEGKAARATCRRAHRAWFAAEAEYLASSNEVVAADIAV